jgi:crotonobetainyl-CoA:carnitine CoA-transferase CaiB-like acyl-CoA transferase
MPVVVPTGAPEATKWLEKMGVEVIEVEIPSLVMPRNSGSASERRLVSASNCARLLRAVATFG